MCSLSSSSSSSSASPSSSSSSSSSHSSSFSSSSSSCPSSSSSSFASSCLRLLHDIFLGFSFCSRFSCCSCLFVLFIIFILLFFCPCSRSHLCVLRLRLLLLVLFLPAFSPTRMLVHVSVLLHTPFTISGWSADTAIHYAAAHDFLGVHCCFSVSLVWEAKEVTSPLRESPANSHPLLKLRVN